MDGTIVVHGIRAKGRHGLAATGERDRPQPFLVDVELRCDVEATVASDRLEKAIDYVEVARAVRRMVEDESFELIETLASAVADRLLAMGADGVRVRVSKPRAALSMDVAEVAVTVER